MRCQQNEQRAEGKVSKAAAPVGGGSTCRGNDEIKLLYSAPSVREVGRHGHSTEDLGLAKSTVSVALYTSYVQQFTHLERSLARNNC